MIHNRAYPWLVGSAAIFYVALVLAPFYPGIPMALPEVGICFLMPYPFLNGLISLFCAVLPLLAFMAYRKQPVSNHLSHRLFPLCLLPLSFAGYWFPGVVPFEWAANLLFFFPSTVLSVTIYRVWSIPEFQLERYSSQRLAWIAFGGLTLLYAVCGTYISSAIGEHAVDEGHYLIQATSLYEDRDLDIKNNFGFDVQAAIDRAVSRREFAPRQEAQVRAEETGRMRAYLHVSGKSQGDSWYSWHPYGISLLIAPTMGAGLFPRQLVLGAIAALGSMAVFLLCMEMGRSKKWSLLLTILFSLSIFWFVFAVRALPEALGATLFTLSIYAAFIARRYPVRAIGLLVFCCAFMPIVHPRFLPCVGLAGIYFVIRAFFIDPLPLKARILFALMLVIGGVSAIVFILLHQAAYASLTAYPLTNLFWAYPEGAWLLLFSERGMIFSFPATVALLAGTGYAMFTDKGHRLFYATVMLAFLVLLLSLGTTDCWDGGPTMYGRYLLVGSLLLIPGWVFLFERTHMAGRIWMLFLALYSAAYTVVCLFTLSEVGASMLRIPLQGIREYVPILRGLFIPYTLSNIHIGHPYHGWEAFTVNPFPLLLLLATVVIAWPSPYGIRAKLRVMLSLALLFVGGVALHIRHGDTSSRWTPERVESALASQPFARARLVWQASDVSSILPFSNRFAGFVPRALTLADLGRAQVDQMYSQPHLDVNDWDDRGYRWFTLVNPFKSGKAGPRQFNLTGRVEGDPRVIICIKEGRHIVLEERLHVDPNAPFDTSVQFRTEGKRGDTYLLFRLEGDEGTIFFDSIVWTPVPGARRN